MQQYLQQLFRPKIALQFYQIMRFSTLILIGILLSQVGYTTQQIGQYEYFLFIAGFASFFWVNGCIKAVLSEAGQHKDPDTVVAQGFILLLLGSFIAALGVFIGVTMLNIETPLLPLVLYVICLNPTMLVEYRMLLKQKGKSIWAYGIVVSIAQLIVVGYGAVSQWEISSIFYLLLGWSVFKFCYAGWLMRHIPFSLNTVLAKKLLMLSLPLIIINVTAGAAEYWDKLIVSHFLTKSDFAIWSYGAKELPLAVMITSVYSNSMLSQVKGDIQGTLVNIKSATKKIALLLMPISIVLLFSSNWLFTNILNPDFAASAPIFDILLLAVIPRLTFPQTIFIGLQENKTLLFVSTLEVVINLLLSYWLVQKFGLIGVAWATIVALFFERIILLLLCKYNHNIKPQSFIDVKIWTGSLLLISACYYLKTFVF